MSNRHGDTRRPLPHPPLRRSALLLGVSAAALLATLAPAAAQTTVAAGTTVTNPATTTNFFNLNQSGGTLVNLGTIATSAGTVSVFASPNPFVPAQLTSYPIANLTLTNPGLIQGNDANILSASGVDGLKVANDGTLANVGLSTANSFPALFFANVNNLQLTNRGLITSTPASAGGSVMSLIQVTAGTIVNTGIISDVSSTSANTALSIQGDSSNVVLINTGTIMHSGHASALNIGNNTTLASTGTIGLTNLFQINPSATNITVNNTGLISTNTGNFAVNIGGFSSAITINNGGTIQTGGAAGGNAILVGNSASLVAINNTGTILNAGTGAAVSIATIGSGVSITNTGTITELAGSGIAINHNPAGTSPILIANSGVVNGAIVLSQPGDVVQITGGAINGPIATTSAGAGTLFFAAPAYATADQIGTPALPLAAVTVTTGALTLGHSVFANAINLNGGATTLADNITLLAPGGTLTFAGGTLNLGANTLTLGSNATLRTAAASTLTFDITATGNGRINAQSGNAIIDTSAGTLYVRPNISAAALAHPGSQFLLIATSPGTSIAKATANLAIAPGAASTLFTVGKATGTIDAFGNPLVPGQDIVVTSNKASGALTQIVTAANDIQVVRSQVNAIATSVSTRIGYIVGSAIAERIRVIQPNAMRAHDDSAGAEDPERTYTGWADTSGACLSDTGAGRGFRGSLWTGLAGVDTAVLENLIVGVVVGGEGNSFNVTNTGRRSAMGGSISPYLAVILSDWAALDAELSFAQLKNDVTILGTHNRYTSRRLFGSVNLSIFQTYDDLTLRAKVGILQANAGGPTYTDSLGLRARVPSTTVQQLKIGGEATYKFDDIEPFASLMLNNDLHGGGNANATLAGQTTGHASRYGLEYNLGVRYKFEQGAQLGLQFGGETLRGTQSNMMVGLFGRIPL